MTFFQVMQPAAQRSDGESASDTRVSAGGGQFLWAPNEMDGVPPVGEAPSPGVALRSGATPPRLRVRSHEAGVGSSSHGAASAFDSPSWSAPSEAARGMPPLGPLPRAAAHSPSWAARHGSTSLMRSGTTPGSPVQLFLAAWTRLPTIPPPFSTTTRLSLIRYPFLLIVLCLELTSAP